MPEESLQEDLHIRITRLYFRMLLPLSGLAIALAGVQADPAGQRVLFALAALAVATGLVHRHLSPALENALRFLFAVILVAFVGAVAVAGLFMPLPADGTQAIVLYLFAPVTVFAWGFLFYDQPRLGSVLCLLLSLATTALLWRWNQQGNIPITAAPLLLLLINLIVMYYNSLVLELNRQFIRGREEWRRDSLTGLLNRRSFESLPQETGVTWHIAVLDIDHFKRVNDVHGHPAGDRVLRAVGDVLLDKLNGQGAAYRWGGEEFVVLMPELPPFAFSQWLEAVRTEVASRSFVNDLHVTLSAGVSLHCPGKTRAAAFAEADHALLEAKRLGRNQVQWYPTPGCGSAPRQAG